MMRHPPSSPLRRQDTPAHDPEQARPTPGDEPWPATSVVKTLWPPQPGTLRHRERFGARLVCVRYRHDAAGRHRYTTVELMVDHGPVRSRRIAPKNHELTVPYGNETLRTELLAAGAEWDHEAQVWRLSLPMAKFLGLTKLTRRRPK